MISVWDHIPTNDELLELRIKEGWQPTPSLLKEGSAILGHASCIKMVNDESGLRLENN